VKTPLNMAPASHHLIAALCGGSCRRNARRRQPFVADFHDVERAWVDAGNIAIDALSGLPICSGRPG
jgi:hypothetical protein